MKKTLVFALLLSIISAQSFAVVPPADGGGVVSPYDIARPSVNISSGKTLTSSKSYNINSKNYCLRSTAAGCWFMNGSSGVGEVGHTTSPIDLSYSVTATGGTVTTTSSVMTGMTGLARTFNNGRLAANVEGGLLDITGTSLSISARSLVTSTGTGYSNVIVGKYATAGNQRQYRLEVFGTSATAYGFRAIVSPDGSASTSVTTTLTNYTLNTWRHAALVYNGTDLRIYVDGVLASTPVAFTSSIYDGNSMFNVGALEGVSTSYFYGSLDDVYVDKAALTPVDILQIYKQGINGKRGDIADTATSWTLPSASSGKQHCFRQQTEQTNEISVRPSTGDYVEAQDGSAYCTVSHAIKSAGQAGDSICYVATDNDHWMAFGGGVGSWTCQ